MRAVLPVCISLVGSAAFAQTPPPPPATGAQTATPVPALVNPATPAPALKGSFQLLLTAPPAVSGTVLDLSPRGFGVGQTSIGQTSLFGYIGLSGGVGYCLTDLVEVGGAVAFYIDGAAPAGGDLGSSGIYEIAAEPMIKLNLGPTLKTGTLNPFVIGGFSFGVQGGMGAGAAAWGLFGVDLDPGVEWLFGGRWGVDAFVPLQVQFATHADSQIGLNLGVGYGLVGYL